MSNLAELKAKAKELQEMEKKTTSIPWQVHREDHSDSNTAEFLYIKTPLYEGEYCPMWECETKGSEAHTRAVNDISFVTELRTAAPQLLASWMLMAEVVDAARARHETWTKETYVGIDNALKALDEFLGDCK